jgi:UDP-N-acetylglucosamine acyltransferase
MTVIHPSADVGKGARLGAGCRIGPFAVIGDEVELAAGVVIDAHVVIGGRTTIGEETHVFPFVTIGLEPQDLKYRGESTSVEIGRRNQIREFSSIHRGTDGGGGVTRIGDDNLLMAQTHVAHDCQIGSGVITANGAALAGHVEVQDQANVGAYTGVHQFCRVGRGAFIGGYSVVVKDVAPFSLVQGNHARCYGINRVGMRRRGHSGDAIRSVQRAFRLLLGSGLNTTQAVEKIRSEITGTEEVDLLVSFIESSKRGIIKRPTAGADSEDE